MLAHLFQQFNNLLRFKVTQGLVYVFFCLRQGEHFRSTNVEYARQRGVGMIGRLLWDNRIYWLLHISYYCENLINL
jgi:hypothetical protein